jgi:hypothetical protein
MLGLRRAGFTLAGGFNDNVDEWRDCPFGDAHMIGEFLKA